jgi:hypothetical protein
MDIRADYGQIIGVRILNRISNEDGYYVKYEFKDDNWIKRALKVLPDYIGLDNIKIQTLHPFSASYHLQTGQIKEPGSIWMNNPYFTIDALYIIQGI